MSRAALASRADTRVVGDEPRPTPSTLLAPLPAGERVAGTQQSAVVNDLALAYRSGRSEALPDLFAALEPIVMSTILRYVSERRRNVSQRRPLPPVLDQEDLIQQSWIILDSLARRWNPDGGDFGAYVRTSFHGAICRFVLMYSPVRRSHDVRVEWLDHDDLLDRFGDRPGIDGRTWDGQLAMVEMLGALDPIARRALLLRVLDGQSLTAVAQALGVSEPVASRQYQRAIECLRLQFGSGADRGDAEDDEPSEVRAIERLVEALHRGAGPNRKVPGRQPMRLRTGLSEGRLESLMSLLVERGCIEGRSTRRPGRLVYATAAETLARVSRTED